MSLTTTDDNKVPELLNVIKELKSSCIQVGIFAAEGSKILMIATVNEYGCDITVTPKMRGYLGSQGLHLKKETTVIKIPERSFIRNSYTENLLNIQKFVDNDLDKVFNFTMTVSEFYKDVGMYCVGLVQKHLTKLKEPPNHPFTIERKNGKTNPLINTGELREKITFKVVKV